MSTIVTRSGKGSPLTHTEVDNNFTNLNTDKLQSGDTASSLVITSADINGGTIDGATIGASTASTGSFTSLSDSGNLTFTGTGNRIRGDFSNATIANRVAFQNSVTNAGTAIGVIPNGTGANGQINLFSSSDPANSSLLSLLNSSALSESRIQSGITGTGTFFPITMYTGGSERLRIDTSGNVGIGTSSPILAGARLSVRPAGDYDAAIVVGSNASAANWARLDFRNTNAASSAILYQDQSGTFTIRTDGAYPITFNTNGANERMRIDSAGNVGIGLTNPGIYGQLEVGGSANTTIALRSSSASGTIFALTTVGSTEARVNAISNVPMTFYTNNTERMRIDSSGNVGIGVSSPSQAFEVGTGSTDTRSFFSSNNAYAIGIRNGSNIAGYIGGSGADNMVFSYTSGTERMRIDSSGNLLVGTTSALNGYSYSGAIHGLSTDAKQLNLRNSNATAGRVWTLGMTNASEFIIYANGSTGQYMSWNGTSWIASSDERFKTDLKPIENAIDKVSQLRSVTGRYKTDEENVSRAFLIAQDVQAVFPEAVDVRADEDKTLGLRYTEMIPLLVASIKEQQAIINDLKSRIETLESK